MGRVAPNLNNLKIVLLPFRISYGVGTADLVRTLFGRKATISRAYLQNEMGRSVKLIMDRTMSNSV